MPSAAIEVARAQTGLAMGSEPAIAIIPRTILAIAPDFIPGP
jgi:hypothetical protein